MEENNANLEAVDVNEDLQTLTNEDDMRIEGAVENENKLSEKEVKHYADENNKT